MSKAKKKPVCDVCNDTHRMTRTKDCGDRYEVMCTSCPAPCRACRSGGNGPFCETTPCACSCHVGNWRYPERVATATTATFAETRDGVTSYPLPPCPVCGGPVELQPARCVGRCATPAGHDTADTHAVLGEDGAECNACGAALDGDCDHCCVACLDGNVCPACAPKVDAPRVLVKVLRHGVGLPAYQTSGAAGMDLHAAWDKEVPASVIAGSASWGRHGALQVNPDAIISIPTGIAAAIPTGWEGQVRGRSGLLAKHGVYAPQTGTIDSDYRGEIRVVLKNEGRAPFVIRRGDRIAQLVIAPAPQAVLEQVDELPETQRGEGGFGSTGVGGGR